MVNETQVYEVVDYEKDIKPHFFTAIYAGVGSGKTTFAEKFIKGDSEHNIPKKTVLLITSRKSKVLETLTENDLPISGKVGKWGNYHRKYDEKTDDEQYARVIDRGDSGKVIVYQQSVTCTNAFIENYLRYVYEPTDETTHLWELFDMIIVDEVHSVIVDATYQSAPFYICELVSETLKRKRKADRGTGKQIACENIILMTGTPEPIEGLTVDNTLNLMDKCKNVSPKNVFFIDSDKAQEQILQQNQRGEKLIYFSNSSYTSSEFSQKFGVDESGVATSFSKASKRTFLKNSDNEKYEFMEETERALREDKLLPDSVKCFVTTSRNKEGINILNKDFGSMYIESHNGSDIVQMAGRLRDGVNNLYIIVVSKSNWKEPWKYEGYFTKTMMTGNKRKKDKTEENDNCGALNEFLIKMFEKFKVENIYGNKNSIYTVHDYFYREISDYIDYAKEQFPCAQYNYFNNKFEYYSWRTRGIKYQRDNETAFAENLKNGTLKSLGEKWFPLAAVHEYITKEQQAKTILESFLNLYPNGRYPENEVTVILRDKLEELLKTEKKTINGVLKYFTNGRFERCGQNIQRANYRLYKFKYG